MNISAVTSPGAAVSENERKALISLLADDDASVYQAVRKRLLASGGAAAVWLRPHLLSEDPVLRRHARDIIACFNREENDRSFLTFCLTQAEGFDLERAVWMLATTRYSEINTGGYRAILDGFAADLREELNPSAAAADLLGVCNRFLFERLGFKGNEQNDHDPEDSYLNRVVDRRMGNPLSLCVLYLSLTRRLRLPMTGIGFPGHFMVRYQSARAELYVDVFNKGKLLTKTDCIKYLVQSHHPLDDGYLAPVSSRRVLLRLCAGLHQIHTQRNDPAEARRVQRYLIALAK
jgi:regulator of sirC expression with transglutaminase-like and TPR domain